MSAALIVADPEGRTTSLNGCPTAACLLAGAALGEFDGSVEVRVLVNAGTFDQLTRKQRQETCLTNAAILTVAARLIAESDRRGRAEEVS